MLGKIEGRWRRGWLRMRRLDAITNSMDIVWASSGRWWRTGKPRMLQSMGSQREDWHAAVHGVTKSQAWLNNWTTAKRQDGRWPTKRHIQVEVLWRAEAMRVRGCWAAVWRMGKCKEKQWWKPSVCGCVGRERQLPWGLTTLPWDPIIFLHDSFYLTLFVGLLFFVTSRLLSKQVHIPRPRS